MASEEHVLPTKNGTVIRASHDRVDTDDDDLPEQLEQLREEQGDVGYPEVEVPPENESDDDAIAAAKVAERQAKLEQQASLTSYDKFSGNNVDALEAVASLDDFEEDERQVRRELEHSENSGDLEENLQNRQFTGHELMQSQRESDDYDDDYPDGLLGHPIEYPNEPPPAYASPPKLSSPSRRISTPHISAQNSVNQPTVSSTTAQLFLGGMTLAGVAKPGIRNTEDMNYNRNTDLNDEPQESDHDEENFASHQLPILQEPDPYGHEEEYVSSPESYHFNDAIRDQHSTAVSPRVLPPIAQEVFTTVSRRSSTIDESTGFDSPQPAYPITTDLKNLLAVVQQYQAINVPIDMYLLPFDVNYIAAVGDVHPGFRVPRPDGQDDQLGFIMLDEPAGNQTSSTVINLLLQKADTRSDQPVNKLERADKNTKAIDQWIENVKEVRRSRPPDRVVYTKPMPDIEKLMEEWRPEVDNAIRDAKLPTANLDVTVDEFADLCLSIADIPNHGNRIQSLHVLFSLYNEFKSSQHFHNMAYEGDAPVTETNRLEL